MHSGVRLGFERHELFSRSNPGSRIAIGKTRIRAGR
jgi:hypothetical protein